MAWQINSARLAAGLAAISASAACWSYKDSLIAYQKSASTELHDNHNHVSTHSSSLQDRNQSTNDTTQSKNPSSSKYDNQANSNTKKAKTNNQGKEGPIPLPLGQVLASWTTNATPLPGAEWDNNWDRRHPASCVKPPKNLETATEQEVKDYENRMLKAAPTATRHLFLIRHGQYIMDKPTDEERLLTQLGREQAKYTGNRLKEFGHSYSCMVNSSMARAKETAFIIAESLPKDIPREQCDLLREGAPIPPEPPVGHWRPEASQFYSDGARIEAAFRKYFHRASPEQKEDSYEIIVCHANVIRFFACRALQVAPEAWLRMSLSNASITQLTIRPNGRVGLKGLGDAGHIPADKLSFT